MGIYADSRGKTWNSRECRECFNKRWLNDRGHQTADTSKEYRRIKSRQDEIKVAEYFESIGWKSELNPKSQGVDVFISRDNLRKSVEVKTITPKVRKNGSTVLYRSQIYPTRENDDLMALVYGEKIKIIPMQEAIKSGRNVTKFFNE